MASKVYFISTKMKSKKHSPGNMKLGYISFKRRASEVFEICAGNKDKMKEAASHQLGVVTDATSSLGKGLKKSIKTYSKEANRFARSLSDFVDVEDFLKSIHKVTHPEEHASRKTSVVHTPIDWSKYPPSAFRQFSDEFSVAIPEESEESEEDNEDLNDENGDKKVILDCDEPISNDGSNYLRSHSRKQSTNHDAYSLREHAHHLKHHKVTESETKCRITRKGSDCSQLSHDLTLGNRKSSVGQYKKTKNDISMHSPWTSRKERTCQSPPQTKTMTNGGSNPR